MKKRLISLFVTLLILFLIFRNISLASFAQAVSHINYFYLTMALLYFLVYPIVGIERWRWMVMVRHPFDFWTALKIYFIGETLNLALPSKAGDLAKGYFLKKAHVTSFAYGMSTVIFEKFLDLLAIGSAFLIGFMMVGIQGDIVGKMFFLSGFFLACFIVFLFLDKMRFIRALLFRLKMRKLLKAFRELVSFVIEIRKKHRFFLFCALIVTSIIFWLGHFFQIWLFFRAANMPLSYPETLFYAPIAMMAAFVPFTIAGLGAREAVLIVLLQGLMPREVIVLGGLLLSLRYIVPALIGLFFVEDALGYVRSKKTEPTAQRA